MFDAFDDEISIADSQDSSDSVELRKGEYGTTIITEITIRNHIGCYDKIRKTMVDKKYFTGEFSSNENVFFHSDITPAAIKSVIGICSDNAIANNSTRARRPICQMIKPSLDKEIESSELNMKMESLLSKHSQVKLDDKILLESPRALSLIVPKSILVPPLLNSSS